MSMLFIDYTSNIFFLNPNWFSNSQEYSRLIYRYKDVVFIKNVYVASPCSYSSMSPLSHSRNRKDIYTDLFKSCKVY